MKVCDACQEPVGKKYIEIRTIEWIGDRGKYLRKRYYHPGHVR